MWTECTHCHFKFQVDDKHFGRQIECYGCQKPFVATWIPEPPPKSLDISEAAGDNDRRGMESFKREVREAIAQISEKINSMIPVILSASRNHQNESGTRLILDRIFQDVLGYQLGDIKTERDIQGKKADYVLSVNGQPALVVEAKRLGINLKEKDLFQVSSYGAHTGIRWALLTNAEVWHLYYIAVEEGQIKPELVLTVDLRDGLDKREAQYFYMFSKHGMTHQGFLDTLRAKVMSLSYEKLVNALLSDEVISQVHSVLKKDAECKLTKEDVKRAIEVEIISRKR